MTTMQRYRRSALELFEACPWRFDQIYNQGLEDRGDESQRGIAFHACAFAYITLLAAAHLQADLDLARQAFSEGLAVSRCPAHLATEVALLWRKFTEWFQLDLDGYMAAEEHQASGQFTWTPDLVYCRPGGIEIVDWKTYYKGLTETQAKQEFQLKFYLLQALAIWPGFPVYRFTFVFVRLGYSVTISLKPEEIEAFRPQVQGIVGKIEAARESGEYPPIPGSHCTLCRLACPLADSPKRLPVRLTTMDEAMAAAGDWLVLEQRLKALKKTLAAYCAANGPMVLNGQEFSHGEMALKTYPAGDVIDLLTKAGVDDAGKLLTVSGTSIKAADRLKAVIDSEALKKLETKKIRWEFRHRKAGEDHPKGKADVLAGGDEDSGD